MNNKRDSEQWGCPSLEAETPPASQQISRIFWHTKVHRRCHNSPPLVPILCHKNSVQFLQQFSFNVNFNIALPSTSRSSQRSLFYSFPLPPNTLYIDVFSHIRATRPANLTSLDFNHYSVSSTNPEAPQYAILAVQIQKLLNMQS